MLTIDVHLLNSQYRATQFDDRRRPEWPPHPARLFFAAVDAAFSGDPDPAEVEALYAWEELGAPAVACSDFDTEVSVAQWLERSGTEHFVAGNSASSHQRDFQAHWSQLAELSVAVAQATDQQSERRAVAKREAFMVKLKSRTAAYTSTDGTESAEVSKNILELLPDRRSKQPRTFPTVTPDNPRFSFMWEGVLAEEHAKALDAVLGRISRIGHSSSQVSCRISPDEREPTLVPSQRGTTETYALRTVEPGVLDALRHEYGRHHGREQRTMQSELTPYRRAKTRRPDAIQQRSLGDWIVLPLLRGKMLQSRTQDISRAVRAALISHSVEPVPAVISGHTDDGEPAPHIGFLALPDVTHPQSSGAIQAIALSLPSTISTEERAAVLDALQRWEAASLIRDTSEGGPGGYALHLPGGSQRRLGHAEFHASSADSDTPGTTTSRRFWSRTARRWSSVTPVALDRHPRISPDSDFDLVNERVAPIVADMCDKVGLPRPTEIAASSAPVWPAAPIVGKPRPGRPAFPTYRVGGGEGPRKHTTHVTLTFPENVRGPIILGAGRYFGYGLFYPTPKAVTQ